MTTTSPFADRLFKRINSVRSFLCAGFDPTWEGIPDFIKAEAARRSKDNEELVCNVLLDFHDAALRAVDPYVAAVKPNIAFFEQYGIGGLRAFQAVCALARDRGVPIIADVKRGDIASTGQAYSNAFLAGAPVNGTRVTPFAVDAITINPFLGFDTVDVFLNDAVTYGKGLFVLVKTSNPGSAALQEGTSQKIAGYIHEQHGKLRGECGFSGLGAVIGATYPDEARHFRSLMPQSFFLIPGFGAQGGSAADALAGCDATRQHGVVVNASRGLFGKIPESVASYGALAELLESRAKEQSALLRSPTPV
ncbi:MAG: orotidine-5'-phosphate decarboxylase [Bdellovibrionota bacterium]|nr:MAG: orotidine-5'-phosphate decarboxylase [Bdellovibrionota bacterium]